MSVTGSIIAGIGAAGSIASGAIGSSAAGNAASTQAQSSKYAADLQKQEADQALAFQKQQYQTGQQNLQPWLQTGAGALSNLSNLMGINAVNPAMANAAGIAPGTNIGGGPTASPVPAQFNGAPGTTTVPSGAGPRQLNTLAGPQSTLARVGSNGQPVGPTANPVSAQGTPGGLPAPAGQPTGQPLSTLNGAPATATAPAGIDPATGFQTGTGGGTGSLAEGWNQEFQAPTAEQASQTPGYQFQLNEGLKALQNSAAAKGNLLSGNTAEALDQYSQGLASSNYQQTYNNSLNQYQNAYNQFQQNQANQFNRLSALSGTGQVAAGQLNSAGQAAANNVGNISLTSGQQIGNDIQNAGAATASGYVGSANALGGGLTGATNSIGQGLLLSQLLGRPTSTANNNFSSSENNFLDTGNY